MCRTQGRLVKSSDSANYLRRVADDIDKGSVQHVAVSVHYHNKRNRTKEST